MIPVSLRPPRGARMLAIASMLSVASTTLASLGSAHRLEAQAPRGSQVKAGAVPPLPTTNTYRVETTGLGSRLLARRTVTCPTGSGCLVTNPSGFGPGDTLEFTLYVKNTGATIATQVPWSLTADGAILPGGQGTIASLRPGVTEFFRVPWIPATGGNHVIAGTVRSAAAVKVNTAPDNLTSRSMTIAIMGR